MKSVQIWKFFLSVFSCMQTEYGDLQSKSPYSVRIQENTDQKKLRIWTLFTECIFLLKRCFFLSSEYLKIWFRVHRLSICLLTYTSDIWYLRQLVTFLFLRIYIRSDIFAVRLFSFISIVCSFLTMFFLEVGGALCVFQYFFKYLFLCLHVSLCNFDCVKSGRIRNYSVRIRENTHQNNSE